MSSITHLSALEIRDGLNAKRFSSVEVTRAFLDAAKAQAALNCFLELFEDGALAQAADADAKLARGESGDLLGVPVAVKDAILVRGHRTTAGSRILENFVAPYDATVIAKLREAGAVIMGKTNLDEFAMGSSTENSAYGPTLNPWDRSRVPGGSSGGSAAAVAARIAPLSLGTDTGGSIRQPAGLCSIAGLKPTYGRVSRYGVVAYASSLDQVGPFAHNVMDCALLAKVLSGHDPKDATSADQNVPDFPTLARERIEGLKIGIPKEYMVSGLAPEVKAAVDQALATLRTLGATTVEVSLPHTDSAVSVYYIIAPAEASSNLARYDGVRYGHRAAEPKDLYDLYARSRSEGFGPEVKRRILIGTYVLSSGYYDAYYARAQKVRALLRQDFKQAFEQCDVIACPTSPTTAFKIGEKTDNPLQMYLNDIFTIPVNLAGLPGMSVPCGFDGAGLPIGLQLIGKPWDEASILRAAFAHESATDWHTRVPAAA